MHTEKKKSSYEECEIFRDPFDNNATRTQTSLQDAHSSTFQLYFHIAADIIKATEYEHWVRGLACYPVIPKT